MSDTLLSEYAYILDDSGVGRLYLITDVEELHEWHLAQCEKHPLFERIDDDVAEAEDSSVRAMVNETEEGKKVQRAGNAKYWAVKMIAEALGTGEKKVGLAFSLFRCCGLKYSS